MDPLALLNEVDRATARLLDTVAGLDDTALREPSPLPGWTRGHVLTHIARNADGCVNLLTWARTGLRTPQYVSLSAREADIEAGAVRDHAAQRDDLAAACARFNLAAANLPAPAWAAEVEWLSGRRSPAADIVWSRLREVEIHHVDLDAGYSPRQWPGAFTVRLLHWVVRGFSTRDDVPPMVLRTPEVPEDLSLGGSAPAGPVVSGPAWAVVAWLIGRADGQDLDVADGALPAVPAWS